MGGRRAICAVVSGALILLSLHGPVAQAAMVATPALLQPRVTDDVSAVLLDRLQAAGVDPATARERIAALTLEERVQLAARLDQLPAGGDVLGALAFGALVLLLTDILGYTDVYSFVTRTVNGEKPTSSKLQDCETNATAAATR